MIAEITASNTIIFTASHLTQDNLTSFTVGKPVYSNDTFTFTFTTYNADTYSAIISDVQYVVGSTDYDNYSLSPVDTSYTITPKTIRLNWNLVDEDDNVIADTTADAYTVVYDKTTYTMVASFQTTGEYGVYSADYDEATGKIALVKDGPKDTALVYGGTYYAVNVGTYTASVNNLPSGNYVIATSGDEALGELRTTEWTITRRLLTQIDFGDDVGSTKVYDGSPLSVYFTLPELIEGDTIETFGIFDGLTSVDGKSKLAFKNDGVSFSLSALDAGIYNLVLNVNELPIDDNYCLDYSCNYSPFITIIPRVIEVNYPKTTAEYTASPILDFIANVTDAVPPTVLSQKTT